MKSPLSTQVLPMSTSRTRLAATIMVVLLTASTLIIASPASSQAGENVPTKPQVRFETMSNVRQFFYMRYETVDATSATAAGSTPDCGATFISVTPSQGRVGIGGDSTRATCPYSTTTTTTGVTSTVEFEAPESLRPKRAVSFTGNDSFIFHLGGQSSVPGGVDVRVEVFSGGTSIAAGTLTGGSEGNWNRPLALTLTTGANTGRAELIPNASWRVVLTGSSAGADPVGPVSPPTTATWRVDDRATFLEMRADNAIRAATWVTDERDVLREVFAPIANESNLPADRDRRLVGHFALESAFGYDDAVRGEAPRFTLLFDGRPREVASGGQTVLTGQLNQSASVTAAGVAVWTFPQGTVNYRGFPSGEYTVQVEKKHHQNAPITAGISKRIAITSQSVSLAPYADARVPGLAETQAHTVVPGSSTTYVLAVNNTGRVNDTFTINITAPNAPAGWGASIAGPDVQQRRVFVPAGETRVFTVTVNAPIGATGEIIHIVNVTSMLDPGTRSRDLTLVTRASTELNREVAIIFLARDLSVEPGLQTHFPVYVWNRGTRPANVSLEIRDNAAGWTADLAFGTGGADRIILGGIQPGDIGVATLRVTGPLSSATPRLDVAVNVTHQDAAGISAERTFTFTLRQVSGVSVQVLNAAGARQHVAELSGPRFVNNPVPGGAPVANPQCSQQGGPDCTDDGVDGLWFRVWVTNTGRVTDSFQLSADSFRKAQNSNCNSAFIPGTGANAMSGDFKFVYRSPSGVPSDRSSVENLAPGKTAEFYVWLPVNRNQNPCPDEGVNEDFYSFVIQARGTGTGVLGRAEARAVAVNSPRPHQAGVHLEGIVREGGYNPAAPLVDIQNATKRSILGAIEPGKNATFYVRMTNTARWANFTERVNNQDVRRAPDLYVHMVGVDYEGGWNVSIRPVLDAASNTLQLNPYDESYNLTNYNDATGRREAWFDRELEVVVQAPSPENGTVVAGTRHEFALIAQGANGTGDQSTLEIATIVTELANVTLRADQPRIRAHAGDEGAFLLYISNNGSSPSTVTLRASMAPETPSAGAWQISPNAQTFPLAAFKNRSVALIVRPPPAASPGTSGEINVTVEYARNPFFPSQTTNITMRLAVDVAGTGNLQLTTVNQTATIGPNGTVTFPMTLRNTGSLALPFRALATPIPNWSVDVSPPSGSIGPGATTTVTLVMRAPSDVVDGARYSSVVRVEETGAGVTDNFDTLAFTVNILGGQALPRLSVPNLVKRVDRAGVQNFEVQVQNVGNAPGVFTLETQSQDASWLAYTTNAAGANISSVQVGVNELVNINVQVRAPFNVPERTVVPIGLTAYSPDGTQSAKATLSAEIHDYGVQLTLVPTTKDGLPGAPTEFLARVRNTGNDNDTLNISVNLVDLPEWNVRLSSEEVRLEPNQELEVRATILSPTDPLPASRSYTFPFWVGTRGGQAVNISKNMSVAAVVSIPNYRAYDVDRDGQLEIFVDLDRRSGNGFEEFREVFSDGLSTQVIARPIFDGRTTYFLDVPQPYDGVADVWFNPETVHAFDIEHAPDINGDGSPDYLIDTDRDGRIDKAFDSATERFWEATQVSVYGDSRIQYLIDITGDGRPDRFFDPETNRVTRTQNTGGVGADLVGIDVDDDARVDYYYNTRTRETSGAEVQNIGGFAARYWYFFLAFAALVLVTVMLIVRRRRAPPAP